MCDPVMASVLIGSAVLKGLGEKQDLEAESANLETQAHIRELAAGDARLRGQIRAGQERMKGTQEAAERTVRYAESNVDTTTGTPADVVAAGLNMNSLEALDIQNQAAREAWGLETEASTLRARATNTRRAANSRFTASIIGGAGGAASFYRKSAG